MELTDIWGVGPVKAQGLIKQGFHSVAELRALSHEIEKEHLTDQQLVGLELYEHINTKVLRAEVKQLLVTHPTPFRRVNHSE
jgi:nucleotidyltransferase/DNA polymerase involved in DNA repair